MLCWICVEFFIKFLDIMENSGGDNNILGDNCMYGILFLSYS